MPRTAPKLTRRYLDAWRAWRAAPDGSEEALYNLLSDMPLPDLLP